MAVCPGMQVAVDAYNIRCVTVGKTAFQWKNDYAFMSEEDVNIMRRSTDPMLWAEVENKFGIAWNIADCLPEATSACAELIDREGFDVLVANAVSCLGCARIAMARKQLTFISTTFSPGYAGPPTKAWAPGGYESSYFGFVNKMKHYHWLFGSFVPLMKKAAFAASLNKRMLQIESIDHTEGMEFFMALQNFPTLGLWSENVIPRPDDYPENFQVTGPVFTPQLANWQPSSALQAFVLKRDSQGRAPIAITFGSMMGTGKVEEAVMQAARKLGMNVVLCCDKKRQKEETTSNFDFTQDAAGQSSKEGLFEIDYVPHDWLLPYVTASVSHGGAGTVMRSLWAGAPCVVCPMVTPLMCDQTFHAQYLEKQGLGAWLRSLTPTVDECEVALQKALNCTEACAQLATRVQNEDGAAKAAVAIELIALGIKDAASTCDASSEDLAPSTFGAMLSCCTAPGSRVD
eukprot:TRINITY_DN18117_c0_g2_i1.p1 TRINITY_DN18117_c0_g2~~TRINITY_DN18117_c0_g2_i1.p1  ORF type:complete len:512 (-),score=80.42 TRINITY_DN18117_c0_g2_i1:121-1497(-)